MKQTIQRLGYFHDSGKLIDMPQSLCESSRWKTLVNPVAEKHTRFECMAFRNIAIFKRAKKTRHALEMVLIWY